MLVLFVCLLCLFLFAGCLGQLHLLDFRRRKRRGEDVEEPGIQRPRPDGCCGQHEVCEKDSLLAAVSKDIEYYEDEELDQYRGRTSDQYTAEEVEKFRDILYTMRSEEVAGWIRSLQLREVALPDELKDDVFMIIGERRGM